MAVVWKTLIKELPVDGSVVWIRVLNIYGEISLAQWDEASQKFTTQLTGIIIPAYQVSRWKVQ